MVGYDIFRDSVQPWVCTIPPPVDKSILEVGTKTSHQIIKPLLTQATHVCPPSSATSAKGCILPPQVSPHLPPRGPTWSDTLCCSFLEEDFSRTNCMTEADMYNLLGEVIEEGDVVLEVIWKDRIGGICFYSQADFIIYSLVRGTAQCPVL